MPWPWRRKERADGAATPEDAPNAAPASAPPGADDDVIRQERTPTGDWMTLPPLPTTPPLATTFRVQTLPEILLTHRSTSLSGSLGHAVSADAPSGVVRGLAVGAGPPVATGAPAPAQTLRNPPRATSDDEQFGALVRPLPVATPEPLPVSRMPDPAVSRALADPLPLATPPARDLPLARVVDPALPRPIATPTTASSVAPSAAPEPPAPTASPATDDRVGGFDLSALEDATPDPVADLRAPMPTDLAPPIQPRTLQRRLTGARAIEVPPHLQTPSAAADAPPALDLPLHAPAAPLGRDDVSAQSAPAAAGATAGAENEAPTVGGDVGRPTDLGSSTIGTSPSAAPSTTPTAPITSVQPLTATSGPAPTASPAAPEGPSSATGAASATLPLVGRHGGADLASSRSADASTASPVASAAAHAEPPASTRTRDDGGDDRHDDGAPDPSAESTLAPTLTPLSTSTQVPPLSAAGVADSGPVPAEPLPLAPMDWQEGLQAPPDRGPAESAGPTTMSGGGAAPLPLQRAATAGPPPLAGAPRPVAADRSLATLAPLMPGTTSATQRLAAAPATSAEGTVVRSLAAPDLPEVVTPEFLLHRPVAAPTGAAALGDGADGPLPLQRTTAAAIGTAPAAPSPAPLPLHTPATAVPSAEELVVRAGLAERGPDGGLLYPRPPGGGDDLEVQRFAVPGIGDVSNTAASVSSAVRSASSDVSSAASGAAATAGSMIERGRDMVSSVTNALSPEPTQQEAAQQLAEQARRLYPHIRQQLESDIRRQLEARNRGDHRRL